MVIRAAVIVPVAGLVILGTGARNTASAKEVACSICRCSTTSSRFATRPFAETGAAADLAIDQELAAVFTDDLLADGQTQAGEDSQVSAFSAGEGQVGGETVEREGVGHGCGSFEYIVQQVTRP